MIAGFWRQRTPSEKWFEEIGIAHFSVETWSRLWGTLEYDDIKKIDERIKDMSLPYAAARAEAAAWKKNHVPKSSGRIVVNPKIDSKSQRRIQCSLPFAAFWQCAGREPTINDAPDLFGFVFENPIMSGQRHFNPD